MTGDKIDNEYVGNSLFWEQLLELKENFVSQERWHRPIIPAIATITAKTGELQRGRAQC